MVGIWGKDIISLTILKTLAENDFLQLQCP